MKDIFIFMSNSHFGVKLTILLPIIHNAKLSLFFIYKSHLNENICFLVGQLKTFECQRGLRRLQGACPTTRGGG